MDAMKSRIAAVVWAMANAAVVQASELESPDGDSLISSGTSYHRMEGDALSALQPGDPGDNEHSGLKSSSNAAYLSAYRLTSIGGMLAASSTRFLSTLGATSFIQQQTGIDTRTMLSANHLLRPNGGIAQSIAVGHAWRDLAIEGAAFSAQDDGQLHGQREARKLDSRSARLSFSPAANWVVRLSRGTVSVLDHLVAGEEVRRTAVSATYRRAFAEGDWEATMAWGRNSRKFREPTVGYLVESAFRFQGVHSVFGRVEQVGSDEIVRQNESLQRQLFMMNKLTGQRMGLDL